MTRLRLYSVTVVTCNENEKEKQYIEYLFLDWFQFGQEWSNSEDNFDVRSSRRIKIKGFIMIAEQC